MNIYYVRGSYTASTKLSGYDMIDYDDGQ